MPEVLYQCMCKGIQSNEDQLQYSVNWVLSRRGILKVYSDRLECRDWKIPIEEISAAKLFTLRSYVFFKGHILAVKTKDQTYHFGLNGNRFWAGDLPFPVTRENAKLKYSKFSLLLRVFLIGYLFYVLLKKFNFI